MKFKTESLFARNWGDCIGCVNKMFFFSSRVGKLYFSGDENRLKEGSYLCIAFIMEHNISFFSLSLCLICEPAEEFLPEKEKT